MQENISVYTRVENTEDVQGNTENNTEEHIRTALMKTKSNKAPGPHNLRMELVTKILW